VYVPLDSSLPRARIERTIAAARAGLVLTPERIRELAAADDPAPPRRSGGADPFYVIFTSGSTGEPKGVVITGACLESFVDWMLDEQRFDEDREVFLNQAPFSFDLSVMDLYPCLSTGGTLVSVTADDVANPKRLYRMLAASGAVWVSTPSYSPVPRGQASTRRCCGAAPLSLCGETLSPVTPSPSTDSGGRGLEHPALRRRPPRPPCALTARSRSRRALPVGRTNPGRGFSSSVSSAPANRGARSSSPDRTSASVSRPTRLERAGVFELDGVRA
jgi:hypothetical protein